MNDNDNEKRIEELSFGMKDLIEKRIQGLEDLQESFREDLLTSCYDDQSLSHINNVLYELRGGLISCKAILEEIK